MKNTKSILLPENERFVYKGSEERAAAIQARLMKNPGFIALKASIERGKALVK